MTALPEAKLAREAEMCYGTMAWVTDYDCWHPDHDAVSVEMVVENLIANVANSRVILPPTSCRRWAAAGPVRMPVGRWPMPSSPIATIFLTRPGRRLNPIAGKYLDSRRVTTPSSIHQR